MTVEQCPVCHGVGTVDNGFYSRAGTVDSWSCTDATPETCRSCNGKGYVVVK